jgi:hypothetical protein
MNSPQCPLVFAAALLSVDSPIQSPMLSPLQSPQMNNGSFPDPTSPSILGGKSGNLFVHKLHHMIFDPTYQSLISWSFNGNSFIVCDINLFSSDVLPKRKFHTLTARLQAQQLFVVCPPAQHVFVYKDQQVSSWKPHSSRESSLGILAP